jgi:deoxyribonuclease IV
VLLGAHVSTAGGAENAIDRAAEIHATAIQVFTKQPNRWAESRLTDESVAGFRSGRERLRIGFACAHDSYLINLATPDETLRDRSLASFRAELERSNRLGLDAVVTHPGNATDGEFERGLVQNVELIARALEAEGGEVRVLIETTAGGGKVLGSRFEQVAEMLDRMPESVRHRVAVCLDTCHVFSAGYDLRDDYDGVMAEFDRTVGLERIALFHLNDSLNPLGSRKDRHAAIGAGTLGDEPFRRIMRDPRFAEVPKVLETPKGDDPVAADRLNLERLRGYLED